MTREEAHKINQLFAKIDTLELELKKARETIKQIEEANIKIIQNYNDIADEKNKLEESYNIIVEENSLLEATLDELKKKPAAKRGRPPAKRAKKSVKDE